MAIFAILALLFGFVVLPTLGMLSLTYEVYVGGVVGVVGLYMGGNVASKFAATKKEKTEEVSKEQ